MTFRCVIFAAVSSKPQASDERDSIPNQIARAREVMQQRGWSEIAEPLIVPGQSRSIDFLHEALEEVPALAELVRLARAGEIDLVVCRDYDRLARTRSLLTQFSSYLARCRVQIYALDKPVEPIPPDQLAGRHGRTVESAATVEAFAGIVAEGEVNRLVGRRYFGMNAEMRKGRWKHPTVAYGYSRYAEHSTPDDLVYLEIPRLVPEEAAIVDRIDRMFLDGMGCYRIAITLNSEHIPSPSGLQWRGSTVRNVLRNPFYCGYIVWGTRRSVSILTEGGFSTRVRNVLPVQAIAERIGRTPHVFDLIQHQEELAQSGVIIVLGEHTPIRTKEAQRQIYDELQTREKMGGRAAATTGDNIHIFTGILRCAECGSPMMFAYGNAWQKYRYYKCTASSAGKTSCTNRQFVKEDDVYFAVMSVFQTLAGEPGAIDGYLTKRAAEDESTATEELAQAKHTLSENTARVEKWAVAYEAGVIDLAEYKEHRARLSSERDSLIARIDVLKTQATQSHLESERKEAILAAIKSPPPVTDTPGIKAFLRQVISAIYVRGREVERIVFRI